jgi:O-antigen/teichoic acid export membrane protein
MLFFTSAIVALAFSATLVGFVTMMLVSMIVVTAVGFGDDASQPARSTSVSRHRSWEIVRVAAPIGFAWIIGTIYVKADTLILGVMTTTRQVGYYGADYATLSAFMALTPLLARVFLPQLSHWPTNESRPRVATCCVISP